MLLHKESQTGMRVVVNLRGVRFIRPTHLRQYLVNILSRRAREAGRTNCLATLAVKASGFIIQPHRLLNLNYGMYGRTRLFINIFCSTRIHLLFRLWVIIYFDGNMKPIPNPFVRSGTLCTLHPVTYVKF